MNGPKLWRLKSLVVKLYDLYDKDDVWLCSEAYSSTNKNIHWASAAKRNRKPKKVQETTKKKNKLAAFYYCDTKFISYLLSSKYNIHHRHIFSATNTPVANHIWDSGAPHGALCAHLCQNFQRIFCRLLSWASQPAHGRLPKPPLRFSVLCAPTHVIIIIGIASCAAAQQIFGASFLFLHCFTLFLFYFWLQLARCSTFLSPRTGDTRAPNSGQATAFDHVVREPQLLAYRPSLSPRHTRYCICFKP